MNKTFEYILVSCDSIYKHVCSKINSVFQKNEENTAENLFSASDSQHQDPVNEEYSCNNVEAHFSVKNVEEMTPKVR